MGIYIEIYILIGIFCILSAIKPQYKKIFTLCTACIIICFQGFRWRTGTDWDSYSECFMVSNQYQVGYVEFGYYWLNKIVRTFTSSYSVFLFLVSTIIVCCRYTFAKQFKANNIAIVLWSVFAAVVFPVRFNLASSIFCLSYKYIRDRELLKFLFVGAIAVSIHQIVVVVLPLYFIASRNYRGKVLLLIYGGCCLIGLLSDIVFKNLLASVNLVFDYMPAFSQEKALAYMSDIREERSILSNFISYLNGGLFIVGLILLRRKFKNVKSYDTLLNMYVFGLALSRIVLNSIPYLSRINNCCSAGFIVMIIYGIYLTKRYRVLLICALGIYLFFSYISNINAYPNLYIPYYSIFSSGERPIVY